MSAQIAQSTASVTSLTEQVAKVQESTEVLQQKTDAIEKKTVAIQDNAFHSPPPSVSKSSSSGSSGGSSGGSRGSPLVMLGVHVKQRGRRGPPSDLEKWYGKMVKTLPKPSEEDIAADPTLAYVPIFHQLRVRPSTDRVRSCYVLPCDTLSTGGTPHRSGGRRTIKLF